MPSAKGAKDAKRRAVTAPNEISGFAVSPFSAFLASFVAGFLFAFAFPSACTDFTSRPGSSALRPQEPAMHTGLKHANVIATLAVRDLAAARRFYEDVIGLEVDSTEGEEAVSYLAGETRVLVHRSEHAGTNQATAATWSVEDMDGTVQALREHGVRFEHYQMEGMTLAGDVHEAEDMRVAWFKDPDGNIHALIEE